ncbi:hypothetical protein V501_00964 [Pseudogymnoascus sp. VKM F-4519 (FW-2642)]|nr:hypothetical protein V501_00964 [Pseudogymnoascus sp. VKM F-4519 (FW-2642)]
MLTTKINLAWIVVKSGKLKKMIVAATNTTNEGDKDEDQDNSEKDEEKDDTSDGSEIEGGEEGCLIHPANSDGYSMEKS